MRGDDTTHVMLAAEPGALVHRLFLAPDDVLEVLVRSQNFRQVVFRERIQLLDTDDRGIFAAFRATLLQQVVVHLAAAQHDAVDLLRIQAVDFRDHSLEGTVGQIFQGRDGELVTQQGLRRHHHQRLAQRADHLTAEHVVDLSRGGRHADLDVLLGTELQVAPRRAEECSGPCPHSRAAAAWSGRRVGPICFRHW